MKIVFVTNIYKEAEKKEVERVSRQIKALGFSDYEVIVHDGIKDNKGYAYGINQGIKQGLKKGADVFVIFNADISLAKITKKDILAGLQKFDVFGFAVHQDNTTYYGGQIDKWRLSGGMITEKPKNQYTAVDFVSGSLIFIKRKVIEKIGLWDESYFFYYDETDFCYRAAKSHFKVGIDSRHFYDHFEFSKTNTQKEYFLAKNRFKFFFKYASLKQKIYEFIRLPKTFFEYLPLLTSLFFRSKFLTNFFSLNFSSLLNKLFHFVLFIFLVRNLSPDRYGVYTLVWAFIGFFTPLIDLGTTNYGLVYLPKEKETMMNKLISMRFFIAGLIFLVVNLLAFLFFLKQKEMVIYIWLTSVVILANVWSGSYLIINSLKEKIIYSSIVSLFFNLIFVVAIIFGLMIKKELLMVFLIISILFLLYAVLNFWLVKYEVKKLRLTIDLKSWWRVFEKSYLFILISFLASLYFKLDVFLLKFYKTEAAVGIYSSGYKFLDALLLLAGSYNITAMPIFSRLAKNLHLLKKKIFKDFLMLLIIGFLTSVIFYLVAPLFLPLVLKKSYAAGITTARIVVFALPFILLSSLYYNILYAFDQTKKVLVILILQVIINFFLNIIFIPQYSFYASSFITVFSEIINFVLAFYFVQKKIREYENRS
jgi:O-antigen/teichoic acid export membrane protein